MSKPTKKPFVMMLEIAGSGGIAHYTYNLLRHFGDSVDVTLYTGCPYEMKDYFAGLNYKCVFRRLKTNPFRVLGMYVDAVRRRPVAVHVQLSQYPAFILFLILLFRALGIRVVTTAHNVMSHERKGWQPVVFGLIYRLSHGIVVHSLHSRSELEEMLHIDPGKIHVIDHGNYMFFDVSQADIARDDDRFHILFFGYIRKYKGLAVLLDALASVKESGLDFCLDIVGKPIEEFTPYQEQIERLGLAEFVNQELGYVPLEEVNRYFSTTSVVALPYLNISQSGVLQLAYAFGKPVVVSRTGGLPEVVEEGRTGYVVEPGNSEELAKCLIELMRDPQQARMMGENARELAETRYSWERISPRNIELYG